MLRLIAAGLITLLGTAAGASESFRWVQYVAGGVEARAITDLAQCPAAALDGATVAMTVRSEPGPDYPVRVCAVAIPAGTKLATIDGVPLPLPMARPNRILLIGDTGCRMKWPVLQSCNDLAQWPFRLGADIGAEMKPDLVIHLGDFHYRESPCAPGNLGCAGSPSGDNWAVWRADFFAPAETLLQASPFVMVRGNHEECQRGGKGWSRTLDPYPFVADDKGCLRLADPYPVDLGGVTLYVMDVATADENPLPANPKQAAHYRPQFAAINDVAPKGPVWLAFHRPIWAATTTRAGEPLGNNATLALAARDILPRSSVQAIFSGHQHTFQVIEYADDLPAQIISGHGGDDLSRFAPTDPSGSVIDGVRIKSGFGIPGIFGFSMLERGENGVWSLNDYDTHGKILARCTLSGRSVRCTPG